MSKGVNEDGNWLMCQIPFPMGDRDIIVTHSNTHIRADLAKYVSEEIAKFTQSKNGAFWSIDCLEKHLASQNYTVIPTVSVPAIY